MHDHSTADIIGCRHTARLLLFCPVAGQHVADVAHTSLPHSQHQVVGRRGAHGRGAVVLPSYHMNTTAITAIDHAYHRSGEGPGCTAVGQGRAHGGFVQPQFRLPRGGG